jgi:hypothetical protein
MRVIADRVNADTFYAMDLFGGQLFVSTDKGKTFAAQAFTLPNGLPQRGRRGDGRGGQDRLYATPGKQGDLWIAAFDGLYHSLDAGKTFTPVTPVKEIHAFGFGKAAPGAAYPALYLIGVADGVRGIFRSDDAGKTWVRINDDQHQWGLFLHITGDPKKYGRVYMGTHGRGTMYGDPVAANCPCKGTGATGRFTLPVSGMARPACQRLLRRAAISTWNAGGASRRTPSDAVTSPVAKRLPARVSHHSTDQAPSLRPASVSFAPFTGEGLASMAPSGQS